MEQVYFSVPGVASVSWNEADQAVMVVWEGWANSEEFQALLDAEVQALTEHQGSRLLADCRQQRVLRPADQERADRDWVPRAVKAGLRRFAIVLPKSALASMNLRDRLDKVPSSAFEVGYFASAAEARDWLAR